MIKQPELHDRSLFRPDTQWSQNYAVSRKAELDYRLIKVDLGKGGQFRRNFCAFRPTTKFRQLLIILLRWRRTAKPL